MRLKYFREQLQKLNPIGNKRRLLTWLGLLLMIGLGVFVFSNKSVQKEVNTAKPVLVVDVALPSFQNLSSNIEADGKVTAWQEAVVGARVNGLQLSQVLVNVGDRVKKGQVLARFNSDMVNAELAQYNASLAEATAHLTQAQADNARAQSLKASGAISEQQIMQYDTNYKAAQARLKAANAAKNLGATRVSNTLVVAPDDGIISARNATIGAVAGAGQELFRLILKNRLEWRAELSAEKIKHIRTQMPATITLSDGNTITGTVRQISPNVNEKTNSATVYVDILDSAVARAGMFAKGSFELLAYQALTVPTTALVVRDGFNYVFTVNDKKQVVQNKVQIGQRNKDRVEIVSGITAEQEVISSGSGFLKDGDLVGINPNK